MAAGIPSDLTHILGANEHIEVFLKQKFYHPRFNIDSVYITNERVILRHLHFLGLFKKYTDFNYRDITNVELNKGILRSTLTLTLRFTGETLSLNDLPNLDAERAYGIIRENVNRFQEPPNRLRSS